MTTPTGQISLSDVRLEIYGSATGSIDMNDPNVYTLAGVASGSAISMSQLKGKTWNPVSLNGGSFLASGTTSSSCAYIVGSNGFEKRIINGVTSNVHQWLASGTAGSYQVMATKTSGSTPTGNALGVWITLSSDVEWQVNQTGTGETTCTLSVQIRAVGGSTILASASVTLDAANGV
jgi:hypothetical protein